VNGDFFRPEEESAMLSAVVLTRNEEKNIERCLRSVQFADEMVVVDALSVDRTVAMAERLGARVVRRRWPGFSEQREFAIGEARGDWVLMIDADEEVSPALADEIRTVLAKPEGAVGFRVPRRNQFLGAWMNHGPWSRDVHIRLFEKSRARIARRPVHEGVHIDGPVGILQSPLNHYTHQTLTESIDRMNRYTSLEATERVGRRTIRPFDMIVPPIGIFLRYYIAGGCWKAGMPGFLLAATTAMYRSVLYMKIFLLQRERNAPGR
jgi:glycosyltransferase involved in cell wall biosynthesis